MNTPLRKNIFHTLYLAAMACLGTHAIYGVNYFSELYSLATQRLSPAMTPVLMHRASIACAASTILSYSLGYKTCATLCGLGALVTHIASHMEQKPTTSTSTPSQQHTTDNSHHLLSRGYARLTAIKQQIVGGNRPRQTTSQVYLQLFQPPLQQHTYLKNIDTLEYPGEFPLSRLIEREMAFTLPPNIASQQPGNYHVFYHAHTGEHRIAQEFMRHLYEFEQQQCLPDFIPLRFWHKAPLERTNAITYIKDFELLTHLHNDSQPNISSDLLSANISLFGNLTNGDSCTLNFYLNNRCLWKTMDISTLLTSIFNFYEFDTRYLYALIQLAHAPMAKRGRLLQIFIPRKLVDTTVYLAQPKGYPYEKDLRVGGFREITAHNGEKCSIQCSISSVLDALQNGSLLHTLSTHIPRDITQRTVSALQARILLGKDIMLNPYSGVKIFSIDNAPRTARDTYQQHIISITCNILLDWLIRVRDNKVSNIVLRRIKDTPLGTLVGTRDTTKINTLIKTLEEYARESIQRSTEL